MSYFDHVRCSSCRAMLDPEEIGPAGMKCPKCGADLSMKDLFGEKASFAEDDLPELGLEDLMGKVAQPGADYKPPKAPPKRAPGTAPPGVKPAGLAASRPVTAPQAAASPAPRVRSVGLNAPTTAAPPAKPTPDAAKMVHLPRKDEEEEPQPPTPAARRVPGKTSAADVMRALKKKR